MTDSDPDTDPPSARRLDRWLGDGGMPLLAALGLNFTGYGDGFAVAEWTPTPMACNPRGTVQGGVQATVLDGAMNFALATRVPPRTAASLVDMTISTMQPVPSAEPLTVRGEVIRVGGRVAYLRSSIEHAGECLSHATATFYVKRPG